MRLETEALGVRRVGVDGRGLPVAGALGSDSDWRRLQDGLRFAAGWTLGSVVQGARMFRLDGLSDKAAGIRDPCAGQDERSEMVLFPIELQQVRSLRLLLAAAVRMLKTGASTAFQFPMTRFLIFIVFLGLGLIAAGAADEGFVPIFDGASLDGWRVLPAERTADWTVRDGVLVGRAQGEGSDLIWTGGELSDFELKLSYRISSPANSGIHVRGLVGQSETHRISGYHVDFGHVGIGAHALGAWDFHGYWRGHNLADRGVLVTIDDAGEKTFAELEGALTPDDIRIDGWNEVHVIVEGNRFAFTINDKAASGVIDNESSKRIDSGVIGLQMHSGKPMWVEFKDIVLKAGSR